MKRLVGKPEVGHVRSGTEWACFQTQCRRVVSELKLGLLLLFLAGRIGVAQPASTTSGQVVVLTLENRVEVLRAGARVADPAYTNQTLLPGDRLTTYARSRATLRLGDASVIRINERSVYQVEAASGHRMGFSLLRGLLYFTATSPASSTPALQRPARPSGAPSSLWLVTRAGGRC